ncbi:HNH endonuclease signature motif containing protein [Pseudomonas putida]|nr:HNH endonuclease [Pseudomonas monteilii]WGV18606.1 HNH endonuclease signature motif containing protein [Pseudomonas putida]
MLTGNLTKASVKKAIAIYERGERPFKYTTPRAWYLEAPGGLLYPLKYIYALAIGKPPGSFNTSHPLSDLPKLGFQVVRMPRDLAQDFERKVRESLKNPKQRMARLAVAPRVPKQKFVQVRVFERNPDVVAEVLSRANGICGLCGREAPFLRRKDQTPYLEVHHKQRLIDGGDDTVENSVAACPNCHRKAHHG